MEATWVEVKSGGNAGGGDWVEVVHRTTWGKVAGQGGREGTGGWPAVGAGAGACPIGQPNPV